MTETFFTDLLPPGTALIIDRDAFAFNRPSGSVTWREPVFSPPAALTGAAAHAAWHAAASHLEGLLDGMCADLGLDPLEAWREPRRREETQRRWTITAYNSAAVLPPRAHAVITGLDLS